MDNRATTDRTPAPNTGLAKVAVQCSADTFVVNQSLVLRINICGENRHLRQARNRYHTFEMMNWQEITSDLYYKIKPITGYLGSMVEEQSAKEKRFSSLNIWFEMNEFVYVDPFYGEQKSTDPFNMFLELTSLPDLHKIELISQLENLKLKNDNTLRIGAFSNSLHFTVPSLGFDNIENNTIEFEMEYCLTNSDSYGYMDGELHDHLKQSGYIKVLLKIKELIALQYNIRPLSNVLKHLNAQVYDASKAYEALDTNISMNDRTQYYISYRNIMAASKAISEQR